MLMMSRAKKSMLNMASSMLYSIATLILRFVIRKMFIDSFGINVLGYNSTFNSILGMLNLAELGIGVAITYKLYKPVVENNYPLMYSYIQVFKRLYVKIGWFIAIMGLAIIPILPRIVKESYDNLLFLSIIFILQMFSTVATYWFAYKRIVFTIYQDSYLCNIVDIVCFIVFNIFQIIDILIWKNYFVYLILNVAQIILSNMVLSVWGNKRYSYVFEVKERDFKILKFKDLQQDIGNVVISKLGGYVLNSTDALIVSVIMGASVTGYMTNYTTVYTSFQTAILTMLMSIQPSLGNKIYSDKNKKNIENTILNVTFLCQLIGCVFSVVSFFLIDTFISLWLSKEYLLDHVTAALFSVNVYIYIIMYPISLLFGALGFFEYDKFMIFIAAIANIILSVILVFQFGIPGVLVGTNIALLIYWICRTYLLYTKYYFFSPLHYINMVFRCIITTACSVAIIMIIQNSIKGVTFDGELLFVIRGFLYTFTIFCINIISFYKTDQFHYMWNLISNIIKRRCDN